jgi:hypothetical protein
MRHWLKPAVAVAALLTASTACTGVRHQTATKPGPTPAPAPAAAKAPPTLLLATKSGIEAVSAADGTVRYQVAGGVATADGSAVIAIEGDRLVVRDARTGSTRQKVPVGPGLVVSAISADASLVALTTAAPATYLPAGRAHTQIAVVQLAAGTVSRYDLMGNFAPDTFSTGGDLFLVSYLPADKPDHYQITLLDRTADIVDGVFGRDKTPPEDMRGIAGTRALAPDGTTLYTLYLRPPSPPSPPSPDQADLRAEVHTLKLDQNWANCIDLPAGFGGPDLSASSIAVSPNGARVYAVDRSMGRLVEIDPAALAITRSVDIAFTDASASTALVVGADGRIYLSDGANVLVVRTDTLAVADHWPTAGPVTGLAVATAGDAVFASSAHHVDVFAPNGGRQASTPVPPDALAISRILT